MWDTSQELVRDITHFFSGCKICQKQEVTKLETSFLQAGEREKINQTLFYYLFIITDFASSLFVKTAEGPDQLKIVWVCTPVHLSSHWLIGTFAMGSSQGPGNAWEPLLELKPLPWCES